ncbi:MYCBP-associated protein isoform X2 [Perognathus longimembris pacificus]|uniref:MYCBP-associated protein isoform X2 n=1 Tax=Perognathus longimembris pacificus TaxID=214514 RepID=UPI002019BA31|nr:MYCBP-associated protein isoform X2 [Perognathus longimembris pacificus]
MKAIKKESRVKMPTSRLVDATDTVREKKRAKAPEQPTPPIQEEPEPVSNVLQGDDILALGIKKEDLEKQHLPRLSEMENKPVITRKFIIRKLKPKDSRKKVCHLVAHSTNPDFTTKPLDYSGLGDKLDDSDKILPHHILGSLKDFKRIAVARGNMKLAEMIHTEPCLMTVISAKEEPEPKAPKEEKRPPCALPPQHNSLKNWQRHIALRKKQQEALSEQLNKPVNELLMHTGETYRRIQEERELISRVLPMQYNEKTSTGFWSPLECLGDELTGVIMTKTKTQCGLVEPITHIRKPYAIQMETGIPGRKDAWYRYTWDRSLFLIYRRKELQDLMAELDFSQQDIDGLEVVGQGQSFSSLTVDDYSVFERSAESSSSEDTIGLLSCYPDLGPMPILGPSLMFCGKPAVWIKSNNPKGKRNVGIAVRLTFENLEGEKTSSELTVVNNGTAAIWYDWRRQPLLDCFQDLKRDRMQRFYFNNREGVILPGETKKFTFFFKSANAGIFRESWEFGTHPALLGGSILQVNLHAVSLAQDILREERLLMESKLNAQEAVTIVKSVMEELLRGVWTPERTPSPVDAYLTEEELFQHKHPQLHYKHRVIQNLHQLWHEYIILPFKAQDEHLSSKAHGTTAPSSSLEKSPAHAEHLAHIRSLLMESSRQEHDSHRDSRDSSLSQKCGGDIWFSPRKSIMEEVLVEENLETEGTRSPWESDSMPLPEWNLSLEDFRKAVMTLPEENQREGALVQLNKAALELCQDQKPLQSNLLHQLCLQLWRDMIDSLVGHSLWLRVLLGLPEKETIYADTPGELVQKSTPTIEVKVPTVKLGKEERKVAAQEKKQLGIKEKEDKKGVKTPGKEERLNSKKLKAKEDKKVIKSSSRDRLSSEDPAAMDTATSSQEPMDPQVMEKYTRRLYTEVYGLLESLVINMMVLADEVNPMKSAYDS